MSPEGQTRESQLNRESAASDKTLKEVIESLPAIDEETLTASAEALSKVVLDRLQANALRPGLVFTEREENSIRELEPHMFSITKKLYPEIAKGEYRLILGDDASGRIPTLIMRDVMKSLDASGMAEPLVRFVAGSTDLVDIDEKQEKQTLVSEKAVALRDEMIKNDGHVGKVLIVTDTIVSGRSVGFLVEALKSAGISADVATVALEAAYVPNGVAEAPARAKMLKKEWGNNVVYSSTETPDIYQTKAGAGVGKEATSLHAYVIAGSQNQLEINRAREIVKEIAANIVSDIRSEQRSKTEPKGLMTALTKFFRLNSRQ